MTIFKSLMLATAAVSMVACSQNDPFTENPNTNGDDSSISIKSPVIANTLPTRSVEVPVKDGYVTNVYCDGVLVGYTNFTTTMSVPAKSMLESERSRAVENPLPLITFEYVTNNSSSLIGGAESYQTICFEDSKSSKDGDYNDLVVAAHIAQTPESMTIDIKPIALGSTKNIELGYIVLDSEGNVVKSREIISSNVRKDLFKADEVKYSYAYETKYIPTKDGKTVRKLLLTDGTTADLEYTETTDENGYYDVKFADKTKLTQLFDTDGKTPVYEYVENPFINSVASDLYYYKIDEEGKMTNEKEDKPYSTICNKKVFETKTITYTKSSENLSLDYKIVFYIVVDRKTSVSGQDTFKTIYAMPSSAKFIKSEGEDNFLTTYSKPLGIVIAGTNLEDCQFNYPRENTPISDTYPTFEEWLNGGILDLSAPTSYTFFDAIGTDALSSDKTNLFNFTK